MLIFVLQFASVFLLYFLFSATVDWEKFDVSYFAWSGLVAGLVVVAEVAWIYLTQDIWLSGAVNRDLIFSGWGTNNNMGAMITTALPFAFYLAQKKKHNSIYLILALILSVGVVFSCSRGSVVVAVPVAIISYIYAFVKTKDKREYAITSALLVVALVIAATLFWDRAVIVFERVPAILDHADGGLVFNHSGRFEIYKQGFEIFSKHPILGDGFYFSAYEFNEFSVVDRFSNFFPPRMHNTIIQMLASCGFVGLLAYGFHRWQTIRLLVKRWSIENAYISLYLVSLLGMSMLDCHFFNVGPTLFYSMALAVAEFGQSCDEIEHEVAEPLDENEVDDISLLTEPHTCDIITEKDSTVQGGLLE